MIQSGKGHDHIVAAGETLYAIAQQNGFTVGKLWNAPENRHLRDRLRTPEVLFPGDVVHIPERTLKTEEITTGQSHRLRLTRPRLVLRLQFRDGDGEVFANCPYELSIRGTTLIGKLDGNGELEVDVTPFSGAAMIVITDEDQETHEWILSIGYLDPEAEVEGAQARLNNLGFAAGLEDGVVGPQTLSALLAFQKHFALEETGELDDATMGKLLDVHGS